MSAADRRVIAPVLFAALAAALGMVTWARASSVGWTLSALDTTGWLALGLNVWGNFEIAHKSMRGWLIRILCNAFYLPYCVHTEAWALFWNHVLFAGINVYGWVVWSRARRTDPWLGQQVGVTGYVNEDH